MTNTAVLDPRKALEVHDEGVNSNIDQSWGRTDFAKSDKLRETVNGILRRVTLEARNEGQTATTIPLVLAAAMPDFEAAYVEADDFETFNSAASTGKWVVTQATAGTAGCVSGVGGLLQLDSNSTTADQGIQVQRAQANFSPTAGQKIYFGCRFKIVDTIDKCQFFAGLSVLDTSMFSSGALSMSDYLGLYQDASIMGGASVGKLSLLGFKGGTTPTVGAVNAVTLAEDTWVTMHMEIDGLDTVRLWINGAEVTVTNSNALAAAAWAPSFACLTEGTNDPIATFDWYYGIQTR